MKDIINFPCYVFIDDYFHYPFIDTLLKIFPDSTEIETVKEGDIKGFAIYRVNSNE